MTDKTSSTAGTPTEPDSRWQRKLFSITALLAVTWMVLLLVLSVTSANPVTLNRDQIVEAADVLTVLVKDQQTGAVQIEKSWKGELSDHELVVTDIASMGVATGQRFLIPITREGSQWQVMPSKLPNNARLIYPMSPEAERQLKSILKTGHLP